MAITTGIIVLSQSAAVGKAQYNRSVKDGDSKFEIFDDIVDAVGEAIFDEIFLETLGFKMHITATTLTLNVALMQGKVTSVLQSYVEAFKSTSLNNNPGKIGKLGNAVAYAFAVYNVIDTTYYWNDSDIMEKRGETYGWNPR